MRILPVLSIVLLTPVLAMADDVARLRWQREIVLPELKTTSPFAVPLDSHFFQSTRDGWPDVRLETDRGDVVAFLIRSAHESKSRTVRRFWPADQTSAKVHELTGLQVEIALRPKEAVPAGIRILTPLKDFEHQVQLESSADGETWKPAGPPAAVFDYSRYVDARSDMVPFNAGSDRRFRITIQDPTAEQESQFLELHRRMRGAQEVDRNEQTTVARRPFRIDGIDFYRDDVSPQASETRTTVYPAVKFVQSEDTKKQQSILNFDSHREPITQIKILTAAENFSRSAAVEAEVEDNNGRPQWQAVATGTLTQFAVGSIQRTELQLTIPERRCLHYRIVIDNRDSSVIAITGVELSGPIYELTFLAAPDQKLRWKYGSSDSKAGHYDTAALLASLTQGGTVTPATLEGPIENPDAGPDHGRSWTPWNDSRLMFGTIMVLTGLLGWGLVRAAKRIEGTRAE